MSRKTLLSWSSGKDGAWTLYKLQQNSKINIAGLFCVVTSKFKRVSMHGVRVELLKRQAKCLDLPLKIVEIPYPCDNTAYETRMAQFVDKAEKEQVEHFAFGDLFLENVRSYREEKLSETGITPIFPIWSRSSDKLSRKMIEAGLQAVVTCIDPEQLPEKFIGEQYDHSFLDAIPGEVDPCGENGEFHSFVFDGPMFKQSLNISLGKVVERDGSVFIDVTEKASDKVLSD